MKNLLLATATLFAFAACGNGETAKTDDHAAHDHSHDGHSHDGHSHEGHSHEAAATTKYTDVDPVCDMTRNEKWIEFTANGSDTTWFCSPICKEQFDANPAKFSKKS